MSESDWLVVVGSFDSFADATNLRAELEREGIDPLIATSLDFPRLLPDVVAVTLGPYDSDAAAYWLVRVREVVPDAYVKQGR